MHNTNPTSYSYQPEDQAAVHAVFERAMSSLYSRAVWNTLVSPLILGGMLTVAALVHSSVTWLYSGGPFLVRPAVRSLLVVATDRRDHDKTTTKHHLLMPWWIPWTASCLSLGLLVNAGRSAIYTVFGRFIQSAIHSDLPNIPAVYNLESSDDDDDDTTIGLKHLIHIILKIFVNGVRKGTIVLKYYKRPFKVTVLEKKRISREYSQKNDSPVSGSTVPLPRKFEMLNVINRTCFNPSSIRAWSPHSPDQVARASCLGVSLAAHRPRQSRLGLYYLILVQ